MSSMDKWVLIGTIYIVIIFSVLERRRAKRHALRNAAGQCARCAAPLRVWFIRPIPHLYPKAGPASKVEVCVSCYEHYRWRRRLLWIGVALSPVAMIMLMRLFEH